MKPELFLLGFMELEKKYMGNLYYIWQFQQDYHVHKIRKATKYP